MAVIYKRQITICNRKKGDYSMKNKIITTILLLITALYYIAGPYTIFKVCEVGEKPMLCHWSTRAVSGLALFIIITAALYFFTQTSRERILLSISAATVGVIVILIPSVLLGGCSMKTMACQSTGFPGIYMVSVILILLSFLNILYQRTTNKNE